MISSDTKLLARDLVISIGWDFCYMYQRWNRGAYFGSCFGNLIEAYRLHMKDSRNDVFWIVLDKGGYFSYRWESNPEF